MTFPQAVASGFRNYGNFYGRAARSEYWYWLLFYLLGRMAIAILEAAVPAMHVLAIIFELGLWLPTIAVAVRRLHDVDHSGWWLLLEITIIGMFYPLLVWKCRRGTDGPNRFGPDPSGMGSKVAEVFS